MGTAGQLATNLDLYMLANQGSTIVAGTTPDDEVPSKSGREVFEELGGRFLLRYLLPSQTRVFLEDVARKHWVTPTPYSPEETISRLALPAPTQPREYVLILDPREIEEVRGPRHVLFGSGIEYILPRGFRKEALVLPWPLEVT
jgi:hypothetical protein